MINWSSISIFVELVTVLAIDHVLVKPLLNISIRLSSHLFHSNVILKNVNFSFEIKKTYSHQNKENGKNTHKNSHTNMVILAVLLSHFSLNNFTFCSSLSFC